MHPEHSPQPKEALRQLPANVQALSLRCPLCSTQAPVRGVIARADPVQGDPKMPRWELAFICPACGLYSTFAVDRLKPEQITRVQGSRWAAKLRTPDSGDQTSEVPISRTNNTTHFATTFTACMVLWLLLTGSFAPVDLLWGVIVCLSVTVLTFRFVAFGAPEWMLQPRRWWAFLLLLGEFIRQIVVQNVTLAWRVFSPRIPIKPGIVAVPFNARRDVPATILSSLMTLTPDTVLVDIDQVKGIMYIHWIDVQTTQPDEAYRLLVRDLEQKLNNWLE
jgi:multicomponent Na+:H+ antiporter subunit E